MAQPSVDPNRAWPLRATRLIAIVIGALLVLSCTGERAEGPGAPVAAPPAPTPAQIDFSAVVKRIGLRFRPDGDGFRGGQPTYGVRVRAGETRIAPRVPGRRGGAVDHGAELVLGPATITRGGATFAPKT